MRNDTPEAKRSPPVAMAIRSGVVALLTKSSMPLAVQRHRRFPQESAKYLGARSR